MPCFFRRANLLSFCWRASWSLSTFSGFSLRLDPGRRCSCIGSRWQASSAALVTAMSSFAQVALVEAHRSVDGLFQATGVSSSPGVHCDAFRGQALRVAGTELGPTPLP